MRRPRDDGKNMHQTVHHRVIRSRAARALPCRHTTGGRAIEVIRISSQAPGAGVEQMQPKVKTGAGAIALVAKGEVELYLSFLSEMTAPGIDLVGPLPLEISTPTALVGFVSAHAANPAAARNLLNYLSSSEAADAYKAHWMLPNSR